MWKELAKFSRMMVKGTEKLQWSSGTAAILGVVISLLAIVQVLQTISDFFCFQRNIKFLSEYFLYEGMITINT